MKVSFCVDRDFYTRHNPSGSFEESRAVLLGHYLEKDVDPPLLENIEKHLKDCECCSQLLEELRQVDEFRKSGEMLPYAVCPSSSDMDAFVFRKETLPSTFRSKMEAHLKECTLCKNEMEWLKDCKEEPEAVAAAP